MYNEKSNNFTCYCNILISDMLSIVCKNNYIFSVDFLFELKKCYFLAAVTPNLSFSSTKSSQPNMKSKNLAAEIVIAYFIYIFVALLKLLS